MANQKRQDFCFLEVESRRAILVLGLDDNLFRLEPLLLESIEDPDSERNNVPL